jgi:hypothetical protein
MAEGCKKVNTKEIGNLIVEQIGGKWKW